MTDLQSPAPPKGVRRASRQAAAAKTPGVCPSLYLSQRNSRRGSVKIGADDMKKLSADAHAVDSLPGLLIHFEGDGPMNQDWALIPFALFQQLLRATQSAQSPLR